MKKLSHNAPKGSLEEIAFTSLAFGPERIWDREQALTSLSITENALDYKLTDSERAKIIDMCISHTEAVN